jgi:arylsulfatase A-like enzyme/Flp pilus assembly protein TadD
MARNHLVRRGQSLALRISLSLAAASIGSAPACGETPAPRASSRTSLLLVTLDTLRADRVGAYGAADARTPNLDRLAREGVRFAHAVSPVPLTLPAHASIMTGLLADRHGLRNNGAGRLAQDIPTLTGRLAAAGYRTSAFIGAFVLDRRFGLDRGFDHYDDEVPRSAGGIAALEAERPAREVTDRALAWLREAPEQPFFAWVHLYDAHAPYEPPEPFRSALPGRPYDGEVAAVDAEVGRLMSELTRLGLDRSTLVAVVGDHGEALGEHGELTHGLLLYEGSLSVPCLLRAPELLAPGRVVATPIGIVDLGPTLAGLLGQPLAPGTEPSLDGRDLSPFLRAGGEPPPSDIFSESRYPAVMGWSPIASLRRGDLKYIDSPQAELFDLARDPGETDNLIARRADVAGDMAASIAARTRTSAATAAGPPVDAETEAMLAQLGYVASAEPPAAGRTAADPKRMVGLFSRFEEAHWALLDGRLDAAGSELEDLVRADPANPVFRAQLAEVCRRSGRLERAADLYREAAAAAPGDSEAWYNLGVTLQEAGQPGEAVVALRRSLQIDPNRPEAHNALGVALSLAGDLAEAAEQFRQAAAADPRDASAFNNLGNVLRDLGSGDQAESAYRRAIALDPTYADPWNGLGALEVSRHNPEAAIAHFDRALELAPDQLEVQLNRGIALEESGDLAGAAAAYRAFSRGRRMTLATRTSGRPPASSWLGWRACRRRTAGKEEEPAISQADTRTAVNSNFDHEPWR